jgi:hypothetical protein
MNDIHGASAGADQALVNQAPTGLGRPGFDPSREAFDKNGIPFAAGDVVKVFHFVGARRKRHYMYKQVMGDRTWPSGHTCWVFSHLNLLPPEGPNGGFYIARDGRHYLDYEIVQCCSRYPEHFSTRPRDSDGSGEADKTGTGLAVGDSAGPKGITQGDPA